MSGPGAYTYAASLRAEASPPSVRGSREGGGFDCGFPAFGIPQHQGAYGGFNAAQHQQQSTGGGGLDTQHTQGGTCVPPFMQQEKLALAMQRQPHHAYMQPNHLQTRALDGAAAGRGGAGRGGGVLGETPALPAAGHSSALGGQHHHRPLDFLPSVLTFGGYAPQNLRGTSDPQGGVFLNHQHHHHQQHQHRHQKQQQHQQQQHLCKISNPQALDDFNDPQPGELSTRPSSEQFELQCIICLEPFSATVEERQPLQLHCKHSFCRTCINKWWDQGKRVEGGIFKLRCPACRECTNRRKFPINMDIINLIYETGKGSPGAPGISQAEQSECCAVASRGSINPVTKGAEEPVRPAGGEASELELVDGMDRFSPVDDSKRASEPKGCRCGRTKCLKQYCACFRNDMRCTSDCVCTDCRNDGLHEQERMMAVRAIRLNSKEAFKGTDLQIDEKLVTTPKGSTKTLRGCRCSRSKCLKKYCECFSVGLKCGENCICEDCMNGNEVGDGEGEREREREGGREGGMQLASEATVPVQEQEQKLADSSDNDDMETQEAELVLSTILHGRLGAEEKGKEGQGAGYEDIRQLKEGACAEEEGEEGRKDNSVVSRTHSRMERVAQAPVSLPRRDLVSGTGVLGNTHDEGGEEGMGTSASAGVSAGKTGDMNVQEMMNMMEQKFDDFKKSRAKASKELDEETLKLKKVEIRNDDLENELKEAEEQRDKIEKTIKHLKTKLKRTEEERKNIEKTLLSKQEKYNAVDGERLLFDSFKKRILSMELDDEDERRKLKKPRTVRTDVELDAGPSSSVLTSVGRDGGKEEAVKLPKSRGQVTVDQVQGNKNQDRRQDPRKDLHDAQHSAMRRIPSRVKIGLDRRRDAEEEVEPEADREPEDENEMQGKFDSEDHVLISFTSGNAFAEGSVVLITQAESAESDFYAKIAKYNVERKILKLVYEGSRTEDLKVGSMIVCCKGNACAKIEELDAEWHRGQPWAIDNEFLEQEVRWEVKDHMDCAIREQNGVVWGWLPANESEYFPDEPEEKGGNPGPLWRVMFSADIMPCDLDAQELAKALELYRTSDTVGIIQSLRRQTKKDFFDHAVDESMAPGYYKEGSLEVTAWGTDVMHFDKMLERAKAGEYECKFGMLERDFNTLIYNALIYNPCKNPVNIAALRFYRAAQAFFQELQWEDLEMLCRKCGKDACKENNIFICDWCCTGVHVNCQEEVRADDQGYHPLRNDTAWLCSDDCKARFERVVARLQLDEQEVKKSTDIDGKVDGSGGRAASRKKHAACSVCAARKVKCKHNQNQGADAGSSRQIGGEGSG